MPIRLSSKDCETLRRQLRGNPGAEIAVDLETQSVTGPDQARYSFEINAFDKHRLMKGLDEISLTMEFAEEISNFVEVYKKRFHWAELRA